MANRRSVVLHFSRFDLYEAMGVWDYEHVNAMLAWIQLPFWP